MVQVQSGASSALSRATKISSESLSQLRADFARAKKEFENQLMRDLQESSTKTQSYIEKLSETLTSVFDATLSRLRTMTSATESQVASLNDVSESRFHPKYS